MATNKTCLHLIGAAAQTFHRFGFKKTTMDDIAFAAGKGKSSLYYYFKNKEEVFEAVVDQEAEQLKQELHIAIERSEKAVQRLRDYILIRMKRFTVKGNLYEALNDNFLMTLSFIEKIRNKHRAWELSELRNILKYGIERKEFKPVDVDFMSQTLLTIMIGFELPLMKGTETQEKFEKHINDVVDMFFYGICT